MKDPADTSDNRAKLDRLHSLLFGAENAAAKEDHETALGLALRLLGFLASESKTPEDETYIRKILSQVHLNIDSARRATQCDRDVLEQGRCPEGFRFSQVKPVDLEKIKSSRFFADAGVRTQTQRTESDGKNCTSIRPSLPLKPSTSSRVDTVAANSDFDASVERSPPKPGRSFCQSKLTSLYSGVSARPSEKCRLQALDLGSAGPLEPSSQAGSQRSQSVDVVYADIFPSLDDDDEEASRKRGRNSYLSRQLQKKAKTAAREDDSGDETVFRRRSGNKTEPGLRGDYSDDDSVRRRRNSYSHTSQEKMKLARQDESDDDIEEIPNGFITARQKLAIELRNKPASTSYQATGYKFPGGGNKTLGMNRRGVRGPFVPPVKLGGSGSGSVAVSRHQPGSDNAVGEGTRKCLELLAGPDGELPDRLRNLEPRLLEHVSNEIMDQDPNVRWDDIAGLEHAKKCVTEMVIWPLLRPDIFQGCRSPGKGLLLFGPPGTGKTMIGKAIAGEAKATFFSISASSLTSKWIGEGEKLVRALFGVASCRQPAVIFIDEVDSLLSQRKADGEHESSRRLKTQFLIEMEGCGSGTEQILLIGATNRPQELDEAARRRLSKRLYIPLPSDEARAWIVRNLLQKDGLLTLSNDDIDAICTSTQGYSGSDMKNLVKEASLGPLREALMHGKDISKISNDEMRPITFQDFMTALQQVRPSVSQHELGLYEDWNRQFGSLAL